MSLPSLGIHLPQGSRAAPKPVAKSERTTDARSKLSNTENSHPSKRIKRTHNSIPPSPARTTSASTSVATPSSRKTVKTISFETTPPPSPSDQQQREIDLEGIKDDVVIAVINILQQENNKPVMVKELATALHDQVAAVQHSNNPQAIISSRLSGYLKRPWTVLSPCPLAKELVASHPRRTYYYLTTAPHPPINVPTSAPSVDRLSIISPSLTDDEDEMRLRMEMSPSPDVDLSHPELDALMDGPPTPAGTYSGRSSLAKDHTGPGSESSMNLPPLSRPASPVLEHEEQEFKSAASLIEQRSMDERKIPDQVPDIHQTIENQDAKPAIQVESEEDKARRNVEAAESVFGQQASTHILHSGPIAADLTSSPLVKPMSISIDTTISSRGGLGMVELSLTSPFASTDLRNCLTSPEHVGLDELDHLWDQY